MKRLGPLNGNYMRERTADRGWTWLVKQMVAWLQHTVVYGIGEMDEADVDNLLPLSYSTLIKLVHVIREILPILLLLIQLTGGGSLPLTVLYTSLGA